jgi:capsular polysaccharide biosynthesis protein
MNIQLFNNKVIYKNIYKADINNRIINVFHFDDVYVTGHNKYYPNCLMLSNNILYLPVIEKTMSLNIGSVYDSENMLFNVTDTYDNNNIYRGDVFWFIYNTDNYYHFLYDTMPYIISYLKLKEELPLIKLLMQYPNQQKQTHYPFIMEMLSIVGINDEDIIMVNDYTSYSSIYVSTSYTHDFDSNLPPRSEIYKLYQNISSNICSVYNKNTPKKIYISRRSHLHNNVSNIGTNYTQRRKMKNEDELVMSLLSNGYVEVFTELLTTVEKIAYFANATHVVGCIGGGISNVLFSPSTTNLLAIVSPTFLDVNKRFKYSLNNVDVTYDYNTLHVDTEKYKKYQRVKYNNIVGEIINKNKYTVTIQYNNSGHDVGWNDSNIYSTIEAPTKDIFKLDDGLNSMFLYNGCGLV